MLEHLAELSQNPQNTARWTLQAVITKSDRLLQLPDAKDQLKQMQKDIFDTAPTCLPGIVTAATKHITFGIDDLRLNVLDACGVGVVQGRVMKNAK